MFSIFHLAALTLTVFVLSRVLPGFRIRTAWTALTVAVLFSLLNFFLGWAIKLALFLPGLLTLGLLFTILPFIVNAIVLWLTDKFLDSLESRTRARSASRPPALLSSTRLST